MIEGNLLFIFFPLVVLSFDEAESTFSLAFVLCSLDGLRNSLYLRRINCNEILMIDGGIRIFFSLVSCEMSYGGCMCASLLFLEILKCNKSISCCFFGLA
jgi:hypothetical protein